MRTPHRTPAEIREVIEARGWHSTVAFQTRNPIHRAHEYLQKVALELVDGLLLHPLVGQTKDDDVPAHTRMQAYEVLAGEVLSGGAHPAQRLPGGHALRRATRSDFARALAGATTEPATLSWAATTPGVGNYDGTYDAQEIFSAYTAAGTRDPESQVRAHLLLPDLRPDGEPAHLPARRFNYHLILSGTKVREKLRAGHHLPPEFSRPEVAEVLRRLTSAELPAHPTFFLELEPRSGSAAPSFGFFPSSSHQLRLCFESAEAPEIRFDLPFFIFSRRINMLDRTRTTLPVLILSSLLWTPLSSSLAQSATTVRFGFFRT